MPGKKASTAKKRGKQAVTSAGLVDQQLERYRAMRDFKETAEPSGGGGAAAGGALPFVVQKHAATRLHYDFRLGLHGVLKSWAVTKGPSYVPGDKRLAVQVEDHPMEYGGFEGTIPKGQYGGGTVMLWDEGTWEPLGDADASLAKGNLKFVLHGKKLKGKWVLVRMGGKAANESKPNWLLIKEHDDFEETAAATPIVEKEPDSVLTARNMDGIAREVDHVWQSNRGGEQKAAEKGPDPASETSRSQKPGVKGNKEAAAFSPVPFTEPQLASALTKPPGGDGWVHELKLDGYRVQAHVSKGHGVRLFTRSGLDWTHRMAAVAEALGALQVEHAVLDGEVVVLSDDGQSSFANLQAAFENGAAWPLTYFAFDLLQLNGRDVRRQPLLERKELLAGLIEGLPAGETVRYSQHVAGDGQPVFDEACRLGAEGIISKAADSPYTSGRSRSWYKIKCVREQELVVGGFTKPANGSAGIGALMLGYYEGKKLVYAGRTGTGFTQAIARSLRERLEALRQEKMPFAGMPGTAAKGAIWVRPELVAQVRFSTWTADHLVRQASFKGLREDKPAGEVRLEVAEEAAEEPATATVTDKKATAAVTSKPAAAPAATLTKKPAAKLTKTPAATLTKTPVAPLSKKPAATPTRTPAATLTFKVTHPAKVVDPESGVTKQALIDYYLAVAERMMPHVAGRPLSLVRCPNGAGKQCFYQKHLGPGMPPGIGGVKIPNAKGRGSETYVTVTDAEGLAGLAQMNVLEIHPWGSTNEDLEHPDRIVFDLDPDEAVSWKVLCSSALEVKERLQSLGLASFVKTTGGKGLHVVAPIEPHFAWDRIKEFTRVFTLQMEKDSPEQYISKMSKAARKNKIFVDYLRNERDATAVAPYSSRARLWMAAALPLEWGELAGAKGPRFLIAEFAQWRKRLAQDPWAEMLVMKQAVPVGLFS